MNVRNHATTILIGIATVTIAATTAISTQLFSGMTAAVEESQFDLMQATVESKIRNTEARATTRAAMVADMPAVRRHLAAQDRDSLVAETRDLYQRQHDQFGLTTLVFDVPPALALVRVHAPDRPSEDLRSFRPSVVAVNADHAPKQNRRDTGSSASRRFCFAERSWVGGPEAASPGGGRVCIRPAGRKGYT